MIKKISVSVILAVAVAGFAGTGVAAAGHGVTTAAVAASVRPTTSGSTDPGSDGSSANSGSTDPGSDIVTAGSWA